MTVHIRKKSTRQRAKKTHGWGAKKKHRGAGNRGGRGMAGTGKRADQKKPSILKEYGSSYFGKLGFKLPQKLQRKEKTINLFYIEENLDKIAKKEGDMYVVNLKELGYDKLLGVGIITKKLKIMVSSYSKKAENKIKEHGGEIIKCPS